MDEQRWLSRCVYLGSIVTVNILYDAVRDSIRTIILCVVLDTVTQIVPHSLYVQHMCMLIVCVTVGYEMLRSVVCQVGVSAGPFVSPRRHFSLYSITGCLLIFVIGASKAKADGI